MIELPFHRERIESSVATPLSLSQLREFDAILDARSPAEFADDHLPGAINAPVLDDEERSRVGTVYKQQSAFEAKRLGAPLASRNIARHIDTLFADTPRQWRPRTITFHVDLAFQKTRILTFRELICVIGAIGG